MGGRLGAAVVIAAVLAGPAIAQTPPGQLPPAATPYFGTPLDDKFTPSTLFPNPPPGPSAPPPPVLNTPAPVVPFKPEEALFPRPDPPPAPPVVPDAPPPPPKIWHGSADIGLNGANGNSDTVNLRTTFNAQRKTPGNLFVTDFLYAYAWQDGTVSQQQALFNSRDEMLFPGEPWSLFSASQVEYDQLRAYRFRVGAYTGAGYTLSDTREKLVRLRLGAGAQRELGTDGTRNRWVPEAVLGYDFRYRLDDRNAFVSVLDYYPRIDDWSQYRVRARVAYELIIDPKRGTVLRMGIQDRYDSNPGDALRNDVNYFTTFGIKF